MKTVIVEDETAHRNELKWMLQEYCPSVQLLGEADNVDKGMVMISRLQPELVFLDIHMPGKTGFDLLTGLGSYGFAVVFTTGYDKYAIDAFRISALDYLLKPLDELELVKAVNKASQHFTHLRQKEQIANLEYVLKQKDLEKHNIVLSLTKEEIRIVSPSDILYCEASNCYTHFYLKGREKLTVSKGIFEYTELLERYGFLKCHRSYLVNGQHVKSLMRKDSVGEFLLHTKERIPIARDKWEDMMEAFKMR